MQTNFKLDNIVATLERIQDWHNIDNGHSNRTSSISLSIARRLRISEDQLLLLDYSSRLHDFGRVAVDNHLLSKKGTLTVSQRAAVEAHSIIGYEMLSKLELPNQIIYTIKHHHEHWDGTGYPDKLKGLDIPLFARIVCIADTWDAITSDRPYHKAKTTEEAIEEMNKVIMWFDPALYVIFLQIIRDQKSNRK